MLATLLLVVPPELPGLIHALDKSIVIGVGMSRFYSVTWLFGTAATLMFVPPSLSMLMHRRARLTPFDGTRSIYPLINKLFPHHETIIAEMIWEKEGAPLAGQQLGEVEDEEKSVGSGTGKGEGVLPVVERVQN